MRTATIQCPAIDDDAASATEAVVQRLRWATEEGVDLLVFAEAFLLGHSYNPETIRSRAHEAFAAALADLCRPVAAFSVTLVVGSFEVTPPHIFNSAFVVEEGRIAGRYAKAYFDEPGVTPVSDFPTSVR